MSRLAPRMALGDRLKTIAVTAIVTSVAWLAFGEGAGRRGPALALGAVGLIQADRLIEFGLGAPPWPAVAGYLLALAGLAAWVLRPAGERNAAGPEAY